MSWALRFLGVGNSLAAPVLGSASAVIERAGQPWLLIDCGQETLSAYEAQYAGLPDAVFITHLHMDHIGGLERLFIKTYFDPTRRGRTVLYVPSALVPAMHARLADYPGVLAEGGANWWDAFRLVPVSKGFLARRLPFRGFSGPPSSTGLGLRPAVAGQHGVDRRYPTGSRAAGAFFRQRRTDRP